jgi:phenylpyruvate tautomerase PptA (4-oxalocrotonate tautomerase family)
MHCCGRGLLEILGVGLYQEVLFPSRVVSPAKNADPKRRVKMPVLYIDAPPGIRPEAKRKLMEKITAAVDEAYHIGDTLIFLREYAAENVAMDGRLQSENPKILEALRKITAGV